MINEDHQIETLKHLEHLESLIYMAGSRGNKFVQGTIASFTRIFNKFKVLEKIDGCLHADTEVMTPDGPETISSICKRWRPGTDIQVLAAHPETGETVIVTIKDRMIHDKPKQWVRVDTEQGEIYLTSDHQVYVEQRGWVEAGSLQEGDELKSMV